MRGRRRAWLGAGAMALALAVAPARASDATTETAEPSGVEPWSEAVVSVTEFAPVEAVLVGIGAWRVVQQGEVRRAELGFWGLPEAASASFRRLCAPKVETGCIRLVRISGVEQAPIRPAARAWDTGGIYSLMVRSDDVDALYEAALKAGWWAESPPIRFSFGTSDLKNVVLTGPHGIHIAAYERVTPAFTAFPVGRISQAFNAMRLVKNQPAAKGFYEKLGFSPVFDADYEPLEPAWSNFSIPLNFTPIIRRKAAAMQPVPGETGRVEVMQIVGFEGRDHSARADFPNLGIVSLRYPVKDLAAYRTRLEAAGVAIVRRAEAVRIDGIGTVDLLSVRDPDGSLTTFYQPR